MRSNRMLLLIISFQLTGHSAVIAQNAPDYFSPLHSLAGTWKMETSKGVLYESWQKLNDSTLKSRSYKVNGNDTVWLEQVDLVRRGETIRYIPVVQGQNNNEAIAFTLKKTDHAMYIFENTSHDFPQRIVYKLPQGNSLHAWIEGIVNGRFKKVDYNYTRMRFN